MTTTKDELFTVLNELRATYTVKIGQLEQARVLDVSGTGYSNHQADDATMVYDQTADASALRATRTRLREVEEALAKYEAGTYGTCDHCGQEIDIARLEAIPYTPLCLRCAEALEYQARI